MTSAATGPVMFAYDGSDLAKTAIAEAADQLNHGREALVVTVWQPFNVGFLPPHELRIDAAAADEVKAAAEETAAQGVSLAEAASFQARSMAVEAAPTGAGSSRQPTITTLASSCSARTGAPASRAC